MSTTEPPSPSLSDLCLLAVLGEMNLKNRLAASGVCPHWLHRVREVNQAARSLTIVVGKKLDLKEVEESINKGTFEDNPSVRLLKKADDGSPLYPRHRLTKWNCLLFGEGALDSATVKTIIAALPHLTELTFINSQGNDEEYQHLVEMLQSPSAWQGQLTTLKLFDHQQYTSSSPTAADLFAAINGLTALRKLTLDLIYLSLHDLPILSQLEEVRFKDWFFRNYRLFYRSLQQYAPQNANKIPLRVDLAHYGSLNEVTTLIPLTKVWLTRLSDDPFRLSTLPQLSLFALFFCSLTSIKFRLSPSNCQRLFDAFSSMEELQHLSLEIDFANSFHCYDSTSSSSSGDYDEDGYEKIAMVRVKARPVHSPSLPRPDGDLWTVKALDLKLSITSHADLEWLNLPATMPSLQAIHLQNFYCKQCKVNWYQKFTTDQCLRAAYEILQRTGVPPSQIAFNRDSEVCTMEELLNKDEPSS